MAIRPANKLLPVAIVAVSVTLAGTLSTLRQPPPVLPMQVAAPVVEVLTLEAVPTRFTVRSHGTVSPVTQTLLSAEVAGTIVEVSPKFAVGGHFVAGELLLRIDPTDYDADLLHAKALVRQRALEHEAAAKLRTQGYRAEAEYVAAQAALAAAEADLVRAQRRLERTAVRMPYAGLVRATEVGQGQYVSTGVRLAVVVATEAAQVRLPLTDADLAVLELPGPTAPPASGPHVVLCATRHGEAQTWPATIVRDEGVIDEHSRATYAVAQVEDPYALRHPGPTLPIGSFVRAAIAGHTRYDLARLPRSALHGQDQLVLLDDEERLLVAQVEVLRAEDEVIYVDPQTLPSRRVVLTRLGQPVPGLRVRSTEASPRTMHLITARAPQDD